jgi:SHS2 domain-containing protein
MRDFELIEHTADIFVKAYGKSITQIFENAAAGMLSIITDTSKVSKKGEVDVSVEGADLDALLVNFLTELLFLIDSQKVVLKEVKVKSIKRNDVYRLHCTAYGETFQSEKHTSGTVVKAVTYHMLEINEDKGFAQVLLDI